MSETDPTTRRLVNCMTLVETTSPWGAVTYRAEGGADGIPERALKIARSAATFRQESGRRVVGMVIVDVRTKERWAVPI